MAPQLPVPQPIASGWQPLEHLADPPPPPRVKRLLAQALFSSGGLRAAEALARRFELRSVSTGVPRMVRVTGPRFAILCYHRIGRGGIPIYSGLPAAVFEAQMKYLRSHYRIVSLDEALRGMTDPSGTNSGVAITFDDGYVDLYAQAFPILRQYQIPATIFLTVGAIESGEVSWYDRVFAIFQFAPAGEFSLPTSPARSVWLGTPEDRLRAAMEYISVMKKLPVSEQRANCARLESRIPIPREILLKRMLKWDQIRHMQTLGIQFGGHTMTHPVVSRLTDEGLSWELRESKRILEERLQTQVLDFAFPFGKNHECDDRAVIYLKQLGYRSASTTIEGLNRPTTPPFALRRSSCCEERLLAVFASRLASLFLSDNEAGPAELGTPLPSETGLISNFATDSDSFARSDNA